MIAWMSNPTNKLACTVVIRTATPKMKTEAKIDPIGKKKKLQKMVVHELHIDGFEDMMSTSLLSIFSAASGAEMLSI